MTSTAAAPVIVGARVAPTWAPRGSSFTLKKLSARWLSERSDSQPSSDNKLFRSDSPTLSETKLLLFELNWFVRTRFP